MTLRAGNVVRYVLKDLRNIWKQLLITDVPSRW